MAVEAVLIKPVVDAILGLFDRGQKAKLQSNARKALREAIRELLLADPNENEAAAKIAIAKAAGIISEDILLADDMLAKVKTAKHQVGTKKHIRKPAIKKTAKKVTKKAPD
jgi:hypothetical protein